MNQGKVKTSGCDAVVCVVREPVTLRTRRHAGLRCVVGTCAAVVALTAAVEALAGPNCGLGAYQKPLTLEDIKLVWAHNVARADLDLSPLPIGNTLTSIARGHAHDMARVNFNYNTYFAGLYQSDTSTYARYVNVGTTVNCDQHSWAHQTGDVWTTFGCHGVEQTVDDPSTFFFTKPAEFASPKAYKELSMAENLAGTLQAETDMYMWLHNDAASTWGHRKYILGNWSVMGVGGESAGTTGWYSVWFEYAADPNGNCVTPLAYADGNFGTGSGTSSTGAVWLGSDFKSTSALYFEYGSVSGSLPGYTQTNKTLPTRVVTGDFVTNDAQHEAVLLLDGVPTLFDQDANYNLVKVSPQPSWPTGIVKSLMLVPPGKLQVGLDDGRMLEFTAGPSGLTSGVMQQGLPTAFDNDGKFLTVSGLALKTVRSTSMRFTLRFTGAKKGDPIPVELYDADSGGAFDDGSLRTCIRIGADACGDGQGSCVLGNTKPLPQSWLNTWDSLNDNASVFCDQA